MTFRQTTLPDAVFGEDGQSGEGPGYRPQRMFMPCHLLRSDSVGPDGKPTGSHNTEIDDSVDGNGIVQNGNCDR